MTGLGMPRAEAPEQVGSSSQRLHYRYLIRQLIHGALIGPVRAQ